MESSALSGKPRPRTWIKVVILVPLLLALFCAGTVALFLFMPNLLWTAQSYPVNASVCGRWETLAGPNLGFDTNFASFAGVDAAENNNVWLIGQAETFNDDLRPIMVHWDGQHLNNVAGPNINWSYPGLDDVAVIASDDVWTTGVAYDTKDILTMHWDGNQWSRVLGPASVQKAGSLNAVAAVGHDDVWAVGDYYDGAKRNPLAIHWDGTSWQTIPSPSMQERGAALYDIEAIATDDVWAVGTYSSDVSLSAKGNGSYTLTMHWNGSIWEVIPSPNLCKSYNTLASIASTGSKDVWAVGNCVDDVSDDYASSRQTLVEHWDGTQWSVVSSPNPTVWHELKAVTAITPDDAWAVGVHTSDLKSWTLNQTLALHWDGTQWSYVPTLNPNATEYKSFDDVTAVSKDEIWAVGHESLPPSGIQNITGADGKVLIERFIRTPCPTPQVP